MCLCPQNLVNPRYSPTRVCLSPGLTSRLLREAIEHKLQQMQRKELNQMAVQKSLGNAPTRALAGSKTASQLFFLDDLNCASADSFGIQSPLELLRQILSQGRICCHCRVARSVGPHTQILQERKTQCVLETKFCCCLAGIYR